MKIPSVSDSLSSIVDTCRQACSGVCCCSGQGNAAKTALAPKKKPIKVYILMGQSNMVGAGQVHGDDKEGTLEHAVTAKGLYPYLLADAPGKNDAKGASDEKPKPSNINWYKSDKIRYVFAMGAGGDDKGKHLYNDWMGVEGLRTIGPEFGIVQGLLSGAGATATEMDDDHGDRILIIKSCIGNRALGWDLLPPGSESFEYTDPKSGTVWVHPGYKGSPEKWIKGKQVPPTDWYAGLQYDGDVARAQTILKNLPDYYPEDTTNDDDDSAEKDYEIAGFFFWQGDRDARDTALAERYETNLAQLIRQLRKDFDAPNAKFCCASLGQTKLNDPKKPLYKTNDGKIFLAELQVEKYPEFADTVTTVYSHPYCQGGGSGSHYGKNAEVYMDVGQAMGQAMARLEGLNTKDE